MSPAPEFSSRAVEMWGTFNQNGPQKKITPSIGVGVPRANQLRFMANVRPSKPSSLTWLGGWGGWWLISQVDFQSRNMEGPTPTPWQKTKALPDLGGFFDQQRGWPYEAPWEVSFHRKRYFGRMGGQWTPTKWEEHIVRFDIMSK